MVLLLFGKDGSFMLLCYEDCAKGETQACLKFSRLMQPIFATFMLQRYFNIFTASA